MFSAEKDGDYDNSMIKESIFYAAESAYDFQYLDMAEEKYSLDDVWFLENMGFTCAEMVSVGRCIESIMGRQISAFIHSGLGILSDQALKAYKLPFDQIATETGLNVVKIKNIVDLFSSHEFSNENFKGMSDFNVFNARPIICSGNEYYCFSAYSLAQSIYEAPFFG